MEVPEWLTSELVQKFLGDSQQLQSFSIESATKPGDNFLSIIYRVKVKTTDGAEKSLILKIAIPVEDLEAFRAFPKEILAYKQYIPQFEKFWLEYAGEDLSFGPKCYYTAEEPLVIIVMDDLRPQGFEMRDRKTGLNARETRMVLDKLAKFHACSVKYFEEVGPFDPDFDEGVARTAVRPMTDLYYGALFEQFIWGLENNIENGAYYAAKLQKLRGHQGSLLHKLTAADPGQLNVLAHMDAWVNNLLFNGTESDSTDMKLIDFQIAQWSSPACDLIYTIFNSCEPKMLVQEFDALVEFYHAELKRAMCVLQCKAKVPSLEEFNEQLNAKARIQNVYNTETLALCKADSGLNLNLESLVDESEEAIAPRRQVFCSPEYIEAMNFLLPFMDKRGYLDDIL